VVVVVLTFEGTKASGVLPGIFPVILTNADRY